MVMEYKDKKWADFTRLYYRCLLKVVALNYKIGPVSEYENENVTAIWRHDVDLSPQSALALAKIEKQKGIEASYFFNLRSEFYNFMEPEILTIVLSIRDMGHEVGVHLDAEQVDVSSAGSLEESLEREKIVFESVSGVKLKSFSFHNPTVVPETATYRDTTYAGLINAYSANFIDGFEYCSDSNGHWRFEPLGEFVQKNHPRIYVLTHPGWWPEEPMSPRERMTRAVSGRADAVFRQYDRFLEKHGRKNIGKLGLQKPK
jgi:hypothetical protein